ncbi:MAG: hypothetical protein KBF42_07180 [Chitinophagales bacterium]|jgi:hypothetical protein|nr:hypothetical protein [Bacteroidota bacterium]MBP8916892.1 hypothetical protein [Chitinophagales bacterium]MBP9221147.1 hypothetical protein [Chitinophagales bacterium]MBP9796796.1 hypothetical protein [Chitinophagales bacterium]
MNEYPKYYTVKIFELNSNKITKHKLFVDRALHATNNNIIWSVKLDFFAQILEIKDQYLLSESINRIREIIEPAGFRILVKCSDHDAAQSGMLADMTSGTIIYKLKETDAKGKFARYHVLAESDINSVVSLGDQKTNKENFYSN